MRLKAIIARSVFLLSLLIFSGCELFHCNCSCSDIDAEKLALNDTLELKYSKLYCNSEYEFRLSFDSISDGRCPIGLLCLWEGNASIRFNITQKDEEAITFSLNTFAGFLTDTLVNGLHYELIDILPYPELDKDYQLDDYILRMYISD